MHEYVELIKQKGKQPNWKEENKRPKGKDVFKKHWYASNQERK